MSYNKSVEGKMYRYFKERIGLKDSTKGFLRGDCPYCGGRFTFGINVKMGKVKCFKDCNYGRNPKSVIMYLEGFKENREVWEFLKIQEEYDAYDFMDASGPIEVKPLTLPESYTPLKHGDSLLAQSARNYMMKRGFSIKELTRKGIGYCTQGEYAGYIIFPFYERGLLKYFQGRRFTSMGSKMKNPGEETYGIGKDKIIYNQDALFIYERVRLVESITNSLTLGDRSIATLGKSVSPYQLSTIIKSPVEHIDIVLDPDAFEEAIKLALHLCDYKGVRIINWEGDKDVNDLGKKETLRRIRLVEPMKRPDLIRIKNLHECGRLPYILPKSA